jgi:tetratricopeptide (TPR) repeat protein
MAARYCRTCGPRSGIAWASLQTDGIVQQAWVVCRLFTGDAWGRDVADIFISYSKQNPRPTRDVAAFLESKGYTVWWDTDLKAGERFRDVIQRELNAAKVVIVIWTPASIDSDWVVAEAEHARQQRKLIPLRTKDLDVSKIPQPYGTTYHTAVVDDRAAILAAVGRIASPVEAVTKADASADDAVPTQGPAQSNGQSDHNLKPPKPWQPWQMIVGGSALAMILVSIVAGIWPESPGPGAQPPKSGSVPQPSPADDDGNACYQLHGDAAIAACTLAINSGRFQGHALAWLYADRGWEYRAKGEADSAISDYNEAIRLNPEDPLAYVNRGYIYQYGKEDYDHAIADYNEAIRLDDKNASAYNFRADARKAKGDTTGSDADIARAKQLDPGVAK